MNPALTVPALTVRALTVRRRTAGWRRRTVLNGLELEVPQGSVTALLGQNGSGKTTLMRVVAGLLRASGQVRVFGKPVQGHDDRAYYLPTGGRVLAAETAEAHFEFGRRMFAGWSQPQALQVADVLDVPLRQRAGRLSTGQAMGLALAYALGSGARLLLLDEPTNGLDPEHRQAVARVLAEYAAEGGTVLLSSHVLPEVEGLADRGAFLRGGQVVLHAALDDLRAASVVMQAVLPDLLPAGALERLERLPGVSGVQLQGRTLRLNVESGREGALAALGALSPLDLQEYPRPLAETYAALMQPGAA